jgi:glycolate oxidase
MEMMDKPAIHAAEAFVHAGYPLDVEALLIIELDGPQVEVDELIKRVEAIAQGCGSTSRLPDLDLGGRAQSVLGRPQGRIPRGRAASRPDYLCMDGTIPRGALPKALARIRELSEKYGLGVANVFHAGDGNLHPLILYDANKPGEIEKAEAFGADILRCCVELGGVLTGEHGVGIEKRDLMPEHVQRDRPQPAAAPEMRLRRAGPAQPRQGVSDPAPLRRTRPRPRPRRQAGVSGYPAVLGRVRLAFYPRASGCNQTW